MLTLIIYNCNICRRYCKYFYEYIGVSCFEEKITSYYFLLVLCINLAVIILEPLPSMPIDKEIVSCA